MESEVFTILQPTVPASEGSWAHQVATGSLESETVGFLQPVSPRPTAGATSTSSWAVPRPVVMESEVFTNLQPSVPASEGSWAHQVAAGSLESETVGFLQPVPPLPTADATNGCLSPCPVVMESEVCTILQPSVPATEGALLCRPVLGLAARLPIPALGEGSVSCLVIIQRVATNVQSGLSEFGSEGLDWAGGMEPGSSTYTRAPPRALVFLRIDIQKRERFQLRL
jgi:hypothetical protein